MPYSDLPSHAFWKHCREAGDFLSGALYQPKFALTPGMAVATAGSCFAQNIGRYIRSSSLKFVETEPAPPLMPETVARRFGFGLYSARYGNIYTVRQLRQLLEDCLSGAVHDCAIWEKDGLFFDALRPNVEPEGLGAVGSVRLMRQDHLSRVRQMFEQADVFVFTLGLTECWEDRETGLVFPTAPGVIAGAYDPDRFAFRNLTSRDCAADLDHAIDLMRRISPGLKVLLTVSPVPLTATASGQHVLQATTYSKSVLRTVAQEACMYDRVVDYMPSYEVITAAPFSGKFYAPNLRGVTEAGVEAVMRVFFGAHPGLLEDFPEAPAQVRQDDPDAPDELICEEALLEAFAPR
jgi:hypothetical protein